MSSERVTLKKPAASATAPCAGDPVTVLAVGTGTVMQELVRILSHSRWNLLRADKLADAITVFPEISCAVLITEAQLDDGDWRDVLGHSLRVQPQLPLIVASRHADDDLWMEVLNLGGYNVLGAPFIEREIFRVVSMAWLRLRNRVSLGAASAAPLQSRRAL